MIDPYDINPNDIYILKNETQRYCFASSGLELLRHCVATGISYQLSHYENEKGDQIRIDLFRKE